MAKITDQDLHTACANGDGTFDGYKLARWLVEAVGGKPMDEAEAKELVDGVIAKRKAEIAAKQADK